MSKVVAALVLASCAALAHAQTASTSSGQDYPSRPLHLIIPFAPGGASDVVGRILQPKLNQLLGQQIVIENRAGAAGNIGMEAAAKSAPDGYTLYLGNIGTIAINPAVFPALAVDPLRDFTAVTQVVDVPDVLVANPAFPADSVKALVAYARANPGKLNYATTNFTAQAGTLQLMKATSIDMVHVPYKGSAQSIPDLISGRVQVSFDSSPAIYMPHVKTGKLRILATMMEHRSPLAPEAPTLGELGIQPVQTQPWGGLFGPAKMPKPIAERLSREAVQVLQQAETRKRLDDHGFEPESSSPDQFGTFVKTQLETWRRVAKEGGMSLDSP
jgi:tripartite-type tricarboxylate transporter receptor subunit TctC